MPETLLLNDWSNGWCPSDDPINGRKNGLLRMDSLELDQNGALRLSGGSSLLFTYAADAHTIYAKFLSTAQFRYVALTDGSVYRNSTSIVTGGSASRAAFGAAFDYVIICSGAKRVRDDGVTVTNLGITKPSAPVVTSAGAGVLTGDYEYAQINIISNGAYIAKSPVSDPDTITLAAENASVDPDNPPAGVTEVWIFRRGGDLDQYYRVYRQVSSLGSSFTDSVTDSDALDEGVTLDLNSLTINSTDLPDDILEVVGPVNGRMIYFTKNAINFSETNSPDSYLPGQSIFYSGGTTGAEQFLWARKTGENVVLVGTSRDIYILTGTFITQIDGTLDIYFRHLGVENPPIGIDADTYSGNVVCMTAAGWKLTDSVGQQVNLCDERVDRLYRGETLQQYGGVPIFLIPQYRYSCCVVRDKLFVRVPQIVNNNPATTFTYRMEVYDFKRKYWRPLPAFNPLMIFGQEDDAVMGFFGISHTLRSIDDQFTKQNNGANQPFTLYTSILDAGKPRNRKDIYTIKFKANSGGSTINVFIYTDAGATLAYSGNFNSATLTEVELDLNSTISTPTKDIQVVLTGSPVDLILSDISIDFDLRPTQTSALITNPQLGANKKRIRTWPFKLDNLNTQVVCTPYVDGVAQVAQNFTAALYEKTFFYFFKTDVFGVDYKFKLASTGLFELYESANPEIVETLPIAKQFDQVGPIELFRYGTLKQFEVRLIAFGGTTIPYNIYLEDTSVMTGNITVVSAKQESYTFNIPRTNQGTILRVELGPTDFDFHRLYARMLVSKSGNQTENQWVIIDPSAQD